MFKAVTIICIAATAVLAAELPHSLEQNAFNPDPNAEPVATHPVSKKASEPMLEQRPIYRPEESGRARIEPVRSKGPVVKYDHMLSDQPDKTPDVNRVDNLVQTYGFVPAPAEVAYPDIPYAPGYGYENNYPGTNGYDVYGNGLSNYFLEPDTSVFSLLWSQVPDSRTMVNYAGRTIAWVFSSLFVLLLGSALTVGVCTYTNLCTIMFHGVGPIHEEMRSLITPERLEKISSAAGFVKTAIDKYQKIQHIDNDVQAQRRRRAIFK